MMNGDCIIDYQLMDKHREEEAEGRNWMDEWKMAEGGKEGERAADAGHNE